ncbi:MAG: hypothetical protein LBP26_05180 [Clostridiales bacterium]|jgi:beta-galactosidase|nr:hypothetical protein [Clostridiales bacterium]
MLDLTLLEKDEYPGVLAPRAYYVPEGAKTPLNGEWAFRAYESAAGIGDGFLSGRPDGKITVPSCVQYYGHDYFQYTNVKYPFPYDPPRVPTKNPAFLYVKDFTVADAAKKTYIVFEGVDSCFYLYVNGQFAGFSQISHKVTEFDISGLVRTGANTVSVLAVKWCKGSYFEDQDKWRFSGIFRDVYLLSRPQNHITDFFIKTAVSGKTGSLEFCHGGGADALLEFNGEKKSVKAGGSAVFTVSGVKAWSAEEPNLYPLKISAAGETVNQTVGFASVKIENGVYKINGEPVKLLGVNRHDFHPQKGAAVSVADMENDIRIMKAHNINCVRTSHYPSAPAFYGLCSKYGIYVVCEADAESHGTADTDRDYTVDSLCALARDGRFADAVMRRVSSMVIGLKNNPCIAMWSLGNESGFGANFEAAAKWIKGYDASRPVHYEGAWTINGTDGYYDNSLDVASRMYPPVEWMRGEFLSDPREKRPLFLCEYSHAMGNGPGDLSDYTDAFYSSERFIGGCIWEWADHGVLYKSGGYLYGSDFPGHYNDGNFCIDGLVGPARELKPSMQNVKRAYQPLLFELVAADTVKITNRRYFVPHSGTLSATIKHSGKTVCTREFPLDIPPQKSVEVKLGPPALSGFTGLYLSSGDGMNAASFVLSESVPVAAVPTQKPSFASAAETLSASVGGAEFVFDKFNASVISARINGKERLKTPFLLNIMRAPTDNDRNIRNVWSRQMTDKAAPAVYGSRADNKAGTLTFDGIIGAESKTPHVRFKLVYSFVKDGLIASLDYTVADYVTAIPCVGFTFGVGDRPDFVEYLGYGKRECYADTYRLCDKDVYRLTADDLFTDYIKPQENGSRFGAEYMRFAAFDGGFNVFADKPFSFSVQPHSRQTLTATAHNFELPAPADGSYIRLDAAQRGIGSNSCGPQLPPRFEIPRRGSVTFRLEFN